MEGVSFMSMAFLRDCRVIRDGLLSRDSSSRCPVGPAGFFLAPSSCWKFCNFASDCFSSLIGSYTMKYRVSLYRTGWLAILEALPQLRSRIVGAICCFGRGAASRVLWRSFMAAI